MGKADQKIKEAKKEIEQPEKSFRIFRVLF